MKGCVCFSKEQAIIKLAEEAEHQKQLEEEKLHIEQMQQQEAVKRQIQSALNEQTFDQFRKYASQQYPGKNTWKIITIIINYK